MLLIDYAGMILQIIISNGILDFVTGILAKLAWELGFGPNLGWELGFGTPLHNPLLTVKGEVYYS